MEASLGFGVEAAELWLQSFGKGGGVQFKLATSRLWEGRESALAKAVPSPKHQRTRRQIEHIYESCDCLRSSSDSSMAKEYIGVGIMLCLI